MKKKAAGLEALKHTTKDKIVPSIQDQPEDTASKKKDKVIFSLHLPTEEHEKLRELSFYERKSMTKLLLEGLELVFKERGIK